MSVFQPVPSFGAPRVLTVPCAMCQVWLREFYLYGSLEDAYDRLQVSLDEHYEQRHGIPSCDCEQCQDVREQVKRCMP